MTRAQQRRKERELLRNATQVVTAIHEAGLEELDAIRAKIDASGLPPETIGTLHEVVNDRALECLTASK